MPEPHHPPLIETDGYGCCVGCLRNIKLGYPHKENCIILARQMAANKPPPEVVYLTDPAETARELVNRIKSVREQKEREELDRIASGTPKANRKARRASASEKSDA